MENFIRKPAKSVSDVNYFVQLQKVFSLFLCFVLLFNVMTNPGIWKIFGRDVQRAVVFRYSRRQKKKKKREKKKNKEKRILWRWKENSKNS